MMWTNELAGYLKGARILLIDDSAPFQHLTTAMLHKLDVKAVDIASTLAEGLHKLYYNQDNSPSPVIDLVLMDVKLPDGDGMQGCEYVSRHAASYNIPVIIITGRADPETIHHAFESGASDFLQKPLVSDLLIVRLGMLLKLRAIDYLNNEAANDQENE